MDARNFLLKSSASNFADQEEVIKCHTLTELPAINKLLTESVQVLSVRQPESRVGSKCKSVSVLDFTYICTCKFVAGLMVAIHIEIAEKENENSTCGLSASLLMQSQMSILLSDLLSHFISMLSFIWRASK